jgi:drug/metabolite transporter (DMT)-like permease
MLYGALMQLTFALARGIPFAFDPSPAYMGSLLYLAVFGSVIGFGCYLTLLGRIGADRAGYAAVLFPVVALCLSTLFEDFSWTYGAYLGVVLIMLGNVLVLGRLKRGIIGTRTATQ